MAPGRVLAVLAILVAGLVPAPSTATPATPPWEASLSLEDAPRTGTEPLLTVEVTANTDRETRFRLELPEDVRPEPAPEWNASLESGQTYRWRWTVDVQREGFWAAGVSEVREDGGASFGSCCLHAFSRPDQGLWGTDPGDAIPEPQAATSLDIAAASPDEVQVRYTVDAKSDWMRSASLSLEGSVDGDRSRMDAERDQRQAELTFEVPLADGETEAVFVSSQVHVTFPGPSDETPEHFTHVHCRNMQIERTGDEVVRGDDWDCQARDARAGRPTHPSEDRQQAPGPGPISLLALASLAAAVPGVRRR